MDDFRLRWILVDAGMESEFLEIPMAPMLKRASWMSVPLRGQLGEVRRWFEEIHAEGINGQHVTKDFAARRIVPM